MKTYYCVKSPENQLLFESMSTKAGVSIFLFVKDKHVRWGSFKKQGYKVAKVMVEEVER